MAKYSIDSTTLTGIADAIREKAKTGGAIATSKMAEFILAIKGGLSLDVVTASSLPGSVVNGQIVVITDTTPGTVYIDTDEPASPASGDLWIKLEAGSDVALELTEESPHLGLGLRYTGQWTDGKWMGRVSYLGVDGTWVQYSYALPAIGTPLNDLSWEDIEKISAEGLAKKYFSVGDAKEIVINGKVGNTTFGNLSVWAFIIGIYHNPEYEGGRYIHFQIGKTAQTGGKNICLIDSKYNTSASSAGNFNMKYNNSNSNGWFYSMMRYTLLGAANEPSAPASGSFMAAMPSDLLAVMKGVTKYTDNVGGGKDTASNVTSMTDYLWLPSEYEVFGVRTSANSAEQNYQEQYEYYAAGNSNVMYKYSDPASPAIWWLRSAVASSSAYYCAVNSDGTLVSRNPSTCYGITPCFCV